MYSSHALAAAAGAVAVVAIVFSLIAALIGIAFYVFSSLMFYKLAQKRGVDHAWLAWIPYGNLYLLGQIAGPDEPVWKITH